jgi:MoaA/NifB/PqqE/SkfB family radical SAM enzyme
MSVSSAGPLGEISVPSAGDGCWKIVDVKGRPCLSPDESSHYLYFVLPEAFRSQARDDLWLEIEYFGQRWAEFRVQYTSTDMQAPAQGLYEVAAQRWRAEDTGLDRFRRALFSLPRFDANRFQNQGASFRIEFRNDVRITDVRAAFAPPEDDDGFSSLAPLPELRKLPGRLYPINYLFIEITNACNFKCTWCPDEVMDRRRGFMKKEDAFTIFDEIAEKRPQLGPIYPVKLHQMGEPFLHPDLAQIVGYSESRGIGIELNTNCGLITEKNIDALYEAGLTNLILSYQTPDSATFKTRKAPRLSFDEYRDKVRLAVERKVAVRARTSIEIDIMNTKHASGYEIVSEEEQALAFMKDWIVFSQQLEKKYGLEPRQHDWDAIRSSHILEQDEDGSRYALLDGVTLIWKRCHSWGNTIGDHAQNEVTDTYCPAPYDQFVIHWNGDVVACCTDYEGHTKYANVFAESVESAWTGTILKQRKTDMLNGELLDVCARCQGLK